MRQEELNILMQRAIDGALSANERALLSRALRADPVLKAEFEELQAAHAATEQLFRQVALPTDFAAGVMRRIQGTEVPSDAALEGVRFPGPRTGRGRRASLSRMHRRRIRFYNVVAVATAAVALVVAAAVVMGTFTKPVIEAPPSISTDVEGRLGGPAAGGDHRTDSSAPDVKRREAPGLIQEPGASPDAAPSSVQKEREPVHDATVDGADLPEREQQPESRPQPAVPESPEVVEQPEPANEQAEPRRREPPVVEEPRREPVPTETPSGTAPAAPPVELGKLAVLSGRAEILGRDGSWTRLSDDQALLEGAQVRTNVNGVAMLNLFNGTLVLGRGAEVRFSPDDAPSLLSGEVTLERPQQGAGAELMLRCDDFTVSLAHGCTIVTRKRRGITIRQGLGFATVVNEHGVQYLEGGRESDLEFDRAMPEPREAKVMLPDWSGDSRTNSVLAAVDHALIAREWRAAERRYVDRTLSTVLRRTLRHPVESEHMVALLESIVGNTSISGNDICRIVADLETSFVEEATFTPSDLTKIARVAADTASDFATWQTSFKLLVRPPQPQPARPVRPAPHGTPSGDDAPDSERIVKRVDRPQPKTPRKPGEDPAPESGN